MWWKKHKWKVLAPVLTVAVLAAAFWYGGNAPGLQGWTIQPRPTNELVNQMENPRLTSSEPSPAPSPSPFPSLTDPDGFETVPDVSETVPDEAWTSFGPILTNSDAPSPVPARPSGGLSAEEKVAAAQALTGETASTVEPGNADYSKAQGMSIDAATGKDQYLTDPVPEGKPIPVEPQNTTISDVAHTCTLSISCATILDNLSWLYPEKTELVPENGWILQPTEVTFYEGESVFNVLQRTCKQNKIHMEFSNTPMYNSAYIEGIHNLYEFDCGELSGWMYQVNGWFPNYGCSRYALRDGDVIAWEYTCTLGQDLGAFSVISGG